jgi:hypothetical protein
MLQRLVDAAAVEAEIERVRSLSGAALRRRWQGEFGRPPPKSLTVDLLRLMIANRIQEEAFGTLDRATLKLLDGLAGRARRRERNLKIGTVLVRDYQGRRYTVTVGPDGFVWEGASYSSLSAIARAITGTVWNGPRFFAIKPAPGDDPPAHGRRRAAPPAETRHQPRPGNRPAPQLSLEEANHDRSDRKAPALRRLHPQIDRA